MKTILTLSAVIALTAGATASVSSVYMKHCASCHAADGSGNTRMGKKSGARDYRDPKVQASFSDAQALSAIKNGVTKSGKQKMKGYTGKISTSDMQALVKYVRAFKK